MKTVKVYKSKWRSLASTFLYTSHTKVHASVTTTVSMYYKKSHMLYHNMQKNERIVLYAKMKKFFVVGIDTHATHSYQYRNSNKIMILSGIALYNGDPYILHSDRVLTLPLLSRVMWGRWYLRSGCGATFPPLYNRSMKVTVHTYYHHLSRFTHLWE